MWSLETIPVEFKTTWNTRPIRKQWLGVISSPHITLSSPNPNYKFHLTPNSVPYQFPQPDNNNIVFPCQLFMGKTGFELTALPTHIDEFKTWNWKDLGLTIQIHNDTGTLLPQYNFTISPTENTTLWVKPEFEINNLTMVTPLWSGYKVITDIS